MHRSGMLAVMVAGLVCGFWVYLNLEGEFVPTRISSSRFPAVDDAISRLFPADGENGIPRAVRDVASAKILSAAMLKYFEALDWGRYAWPHVRTNDIASVIRSPKANRFANPSGFGGVFEDGDKLFVVCMSPKSGTSVSQQVLAHAARRDVPMDVRLDRNTYTLPSVIHVSAAHIWKLMRNDSVLSFTVLRNPYARFRSFYNDKVANISHPGMLWIQWPNVTDHNGVRVPPKLNEAITHIRREFATPSAPKRNVHFEQQAKLCHLDVLPYQHIVPLADLPRMWRLALPPRFHDIIAYWMENKNGSVIHTDRNREIHTEALTTEARRDFDRLYEEDLMWYGGITGMTRDQIYAEYLEGKLC